MKTYKSTISLIHTGVTLQQPAGPAADLIHFLHNVTAPYPVPVPGTVDPVLPTRF